MARCVPTAEALHAEHGETIGDVTAFELVADWAGEIESRAQKLIGEGIDMTEEEIARLPFITALIHPQWEEFHRKIAAAVDAQFLRQPLSRTPEDFDLRLIQLGDHTRHLERMATVARVQRDTAVREASAHYIPQAQIARWVQLNPTRIHRIVHSEER